MIKVSVYDWDFRVLKSGEFQSKNDKEELGWAARGYRECGMDNGSYWHIFNTVVQLSSLFPTKPVPPPSTEEIVNEPVDLNQPL